MDVSIIKAHVEGITNTVSRILNKHTDIVSSGGILVITTCLLAAKIFNNIPEILPKAALVVYNFGGIIWLNVQIRELMKSLRDFGRAFQIGCKLSLIETAVRVWIKGINILLTCTLFSASIVAACGFSQAALGMQLALRALSLGTLALSAAFDVYDYFINAYLLRCIEEAEVQKGGRTLEKIAICFLKVAVEKKMDMLKIWPKEYTLADRIVRQLDNSIIETFEESNLTHSKAIRVFYSVKDSLQSKQAFTKDNISLTVLGYISRGICRAFPDSIAEMATRWSMSVLYTDELIRQKFFEADLSELLQDRQDGS